MAKRGRKKQEPWRQSWTVFVYRPHSSGIGAHYLKSVTVFEKPSYDNGFYIDETNHIWAIDEKDWSRRRANG